MSSDEPLISVVTGTLYRQNNLFLLKRAVGSILAQTYSNFEFLVCDSGSSAAAEEYLDHLSSMEPRVRLIRKSGCLDLASKLNLCLSATKGTYIARMDDDDFAYPDRFEKQIAYIVGHPEIDFVGCNVNLFQNGKIVGTRQFQKQPYVRDFLFVQPFVHPTLMFRREALLMVGGYSEEKSCWKCEDYDLLLRLYEHGCRGENIQECLLDYTIPATAKGGRTMIERCNETVTRYRRFRSLKLLPMAFPYVIKPVLVGIVPERTLKFLKDRYRSVE